MLSNNLIKLSEALSFLTKTMRYKDMPDDQQSADIQSEIELLTDEKAKKSSDENLAEGGDIFSNVSLGKILAVIPATIYLASVIFNDIGSLIYVILVFTGLALSFIWFPEKYSSSRFRFLSTSTISDGQGEASVPLIKLTGWVFLILIGIVLLWSINVNKIF